MSEEIEELVKNLAIPDYKWVNEELLPAYYVLSKMKPELKYIKRNANRLLLQFLPRSEENLLINLNSEREINDLKEVKQIIADWIIVENIEAIYITPGGNPAPHKHRHSEEGSEKSFETEITIKAPLLKIAEEEFKKRVKTEQEFIFKIDTIFDLIFLKYIISNVTIETLKDTGFSKISSKGMWEDIDKNPAEGFIQDHITLNKILQNNIIIKAIANDITNAEEDFNQIMDSISGRYKATAHAFNSSSCYLTCIWAIPSRAWVELKSTIENCDWKRIIINSFLKEVEEHGDLINEVLFLDILYQNKIDANQRMKKEDYNEFSNEIELYIQKGFIKIASTEDEDIILLADKEILDLRKEDLGGQIKEIILRWLNMPIDHAPQPTREYIIKPDDEPKIKPSTPTDLEIFLGEDENGKKISWEPKKENNWSFIIVGSAGTGKTQTLQGILHDLKKIGLPFLVFDFRSDFINSNNEITNSVFGRVLSFEEISINPLELDIGSDTGKVSPRDQKYQITNIISSIFNIGDKQISHIRNAIKQSYIDKGIDEDNKATWDLQPPDFKDIKQNLEKIAIEGKSKASNEIDGVLGRLESIFDYNIFKAETEIPFDELIKSCVIIDLGSLPSDDIKSVVCEFFMRKLRFYLDKLGESKDPRLYVIIDEAHRLKYDRDASAGQLLKEARKYGVGMILSTQDPEDFTNVVYNNVGGILSLQLTDSKYAKNIAGQLGGEISWKEIKNGLSQQFSAYVKFTSEENAIRFLITPYYMREKKK